MSVHCRSIVPEERLSLKHFIILSVIPDLYDTSQCVWLRSNVVVNESECEEHIKLNYSPLLVSNIWLCSGLFFGSIKQRTVIVQHNACSSEWCMNLPAYTSR